MTFQSDDLLSGESPLSDYNANVQNTRTNRASLDHSQGSTPNVALSTIVVGSDKRKSLRQQAIHNTRTGISEGSPSPLATKCPNTPTELINDMTNFTFSNFSPVMKENMPLPALLWADNREVWSAMLQKDHDYQRDFTYIQKHPKLRPRMRSVLLDWLIEVSEVYRLHRETFYLAVDFVDRYLSKQTNIAKTRLQLVGVTSLFVAAKIEEIYPPKLAEFAYVTDGACTGEEILAQEVNLLTTLNWKLSPVTPISWVTTYLQIAHKNAKANRRLKHDESFEFPQFAGIHLCRVAELLDLCCLDMDFLKFQSSVLAAAALYHTWGKDVSDCTGYKFEEIYQCVEWIQPFALVMQNQPVKSVKKFDNIPGEDSHNIQVHNNAVQLLEYVHTQMSSTAPLNNLRRTSPMVGEAHGILTPPASAEKDMRDCLP